jgi:cation diffusion facilitator CzcD-associated flavoprotein CzcO/acetyl esterase/lipase
MVVQHGATNKVSSSVDVVVVGAGFAGLYLLHRLRSIGCSAVALESAGDVGGTWYWNRYPGARCDIMTVDYSYSWDPDLDAEWQWSEKYATQPEILRYLQYVADKHDLRRDIRFSTRVEHAAWDEATGRWRVRTSGGDDVECAFVVMATGCLSVPKGPEVYGIERFAGEVYYTSRWPHDGVDFTGKRVAVIGTGSSGVQSIPVIATQASQLTVFQRTPNFSRPALNGPVPQWKREAYERDRDAYRESARWSRLGVPVKVFEKGTLQVSEDERLATYEQMWASGDLIPPYFQDLLLNAAANETLCEFLRGKIRSIVKDPATAEALCPKDHYYATKRPCLDSHYLETFNLPHVRLVDLRATPIATVTETGIETTASAMEFDAIVFATGFDAMTGAMVAVDIRGRGGLTLAEKWAEGPKTYLGLTTAGFPNLFMITGPGSPSVLSNMAVSIEQHVEWVSDCVRHMRDEGLTVVEPTPIAEAGWVQHVNDFAELTLYPRAASWYMGANVPGKPRVFLPYVGGVDTYRRICNDVAARDYLGFAFDGPRGARCHDGVVFRLKPDVAIVLEIIAGLGLPRMETLSAPEARELSAALSQNRPPGPAVGAVEDRVVPGAAGELACRIYRPASAGPHPIVAYFHGGGWVLGGADSDDPFCRDLCVRADAIVVSVDYRHAPEARFPAAVDDAFAAVQWIARHAASLGGVPGRLAVCGWSAGGNLAAVVCQLARDAGGPEIAGQVLVTPVTDADFTRPSYADNAEGYVLTTPLMRWFWDHYADAADRLDPRAAPLRARDLSNLPPALIVTAEFDLLRDEGAAYAEALAAAGVPVRHVMCAGQIHTSLTAVDAIVTGAGAREEMGRALRQFFGAPSDAAERVAGGVSALAAG